MLFRKNDKNDFLELTNNSFFDKINRDVLYAHSRKEIQNMSLTFDYHRSNKNLHIGCDKPRAYFVLPVRVNDVCPFEKAIK